MRILYLITGLDYGGAEKQLLYLASEIRQDCDCIIVSMTEPSKIVEQFSEQNLNVVSLGMKKGSPSICGVIKLFNVIKKFNPDVVHSHMVHANLLSRLLSLFFKFKLINTAHSVYEGGRILDQFQRASKYLANTCTHVSREGYKRYMDKGLFIKERSIIVDNAVKITTIDKNKSLDYRTSLLEKYGILSDSKIFLSVGTLHDVKDYPNLLNAISLSNKDNAVFLIAGQGPDSELLLKLSEKLNIRKKIRFVGVVEDIPLLMSSVDCFVLSSKYEGMPMVVLEALSQGLPIISTKVGAVPDYLRFELGRLLVNKEQPKALSNAIDEFLLLSLADIQSIRSMSLELAKSKFSSERLAMEWKTIYND